MGFFPGNTLIGYNDKLRSILGIHLPAKAELIFGDQYKPVELQTIYAHNVRISSMNDVE